MLPHRILIDEQAIRNRVEKLAEAIAADLEGRPPILLGLLTGSFMFLADLTRALSRSGVEPRVDFLSVSHYGPSTEPARPIRIAKDTTLELAGQAVLDVLVMLPSCVPATEFETSGARLDAQDLIPLMDHPRVLGLAEVMNYLGVLARDPRVLAKITAVGDRFIDGHAPGLTGSDLCAYVGAGVRADHECTTAQEAMAKIRLGMYVLIREGSVAKNMAQLFPAITPSTASERAIRW